MTYRQSSLSQYGLSRFLPLLLRSLPSNKWYSQLQQQGGLFDCGIYT